MIRVIHNRSIDSFFLVLDDEVVGTVQSGAAAEALRERLRLLQEAPAIAVPPAPPEPVSATTEAVTAKVKASVATATPEPMGPRPRRRKNPARPPLGGRVIWGRRAAILRVLLDIAPDPASADEIHQIGDLPGVKWSNHTPIAQLYEAGYLELDHREGSTQFWKSTKRAEVHYLEAKQAEGEWRTWAR